MGLLKSAVSTILFLTVLTAGNAAGFPDKPVRVLNTYPPGAGGDIAMRIIGTELERVWKQPVITENRPGAGGKLAYETALRASPDGHTLSWAISSLTTLPYLMKNLGFSPEREIIGVTQVLANVNSMVVPASVPANNLGEFLAWVKANPGKANYGTPGRGTGPHLLFEALKSAHGVNITEVQFSGTGQAVQALLRGDIHLVSDLLPSAIANQQAGKARVIAIWGINERIPELPNVQTLTEANVLPFVPLSWQGVIASAAVPRNIITQIAADITNVIRAPEMKERIYKSTGTRVAGGTPEQFDQLLKSEYKFWGEMIPKLGMKPE